MINYYFICFAIIGVIFIIWSFVNIVQLQKYKRTIKYLYLENIKEYKNSINFININLSSSAKLSDKDEFIINFKSMEDKKLVLEKLIKVEEAKYIDTINSILDKMWLHCITIILSITTIFLSIYIIHLLGGI